MSLYVIFWGDNHAIVRANDVDRACALVEERYNPTELLSSGDIADAEREQILFAYTREER